MRFIIPFCLCFMVQCRIEPSSLVQSDVWVSFEESDLFSCDVPQACVISRRENGRFFVIEHQNQVLAKIHWLSEDEGQGRGLWFEHEPVNEEWLGGIQGKAYHYKHSDGPFYAQTSSVVVPYGERYLALEFIIEDARSAVQQHIADSFQFIGQKGI